MTLQNLVERLGVLGLAWPDAVSVRATLGRPAVGKERAAWRKLLRLTFGVPALKVGYAIFGRELELRHLTALQPHAHLWQERVTANPRLAPLLRHHVLLGLGPPTDCGAVRAGALQRGLLPAAWKWLCRQHPDVVRRLLEFGWTAEAIFWVNLLARARDNKPLSARWLEAGRPYMFDQHFDRIQSDDPERRGVETLTLERFFRLVPSQPDVQGMQQFEVLAAGLLVAMQSAEWPMRIEPSSTWKGLLERQRRYNDERMRRAKEAREAREQEARDKAEAVAEQENFSWEPVFKEFTAGPVLARELVSCADLAEEGALLDHCVGDGGYLTGCMSGDHIIVSLSLPLTSTRATLQLRRAGGHKYVVGQLAGIKNAPVPRLFWNATRTLQEHLQTC